MEKSVAASARVGKGTIPGNFVTIGENVSVGAACVLDNNVVIHRNSAVEDGEEIEFSGGFNDLHTMSYREILDAKGFGIEDAMVSIESAYSIRNARLQDPGERGHPLARGRSLAAG